MIRRYSRLPVDLPSILCLAIAVYTIGPRIGLAKAGDAKGAKENGPLSAVERKIVKEQKYTTEPKYVLLALGAKAEATVWVVEDGESLYVDKNGNGDLTDDGPPAKPSNVRNLGSLTNDYPRGDFDYVLDDIRANDGSRHTNFKIVRWDYAADQKGHGIYFTLNDKIPMYAGWTPFWSKSANDAKIIHFGGSLEPRQLRYKEFTIGSSPVRLSIAFITPGSGKGSEARLSIDALPADVVPVVEIDWPVPPGAKPLHTSQPLKERCCYWEFYHSKFTPPPGVVPGTATAKIVFSNGQLPLPLVKNELKIPVREKAAQETKK
jgi:hypothetical protein